ncbi:SDR family oxidoreductase [Candidatus Nomurabacteria bacterium]|nr:SDR family oxidoreductase [Candidatus Nomurabacteria bacterium]
MSKEYTLITGASSGIGLELAKIAASNKRNLVLVARDKRALEKLKTELTDNTVDVQILSIDLTDSASASSLYNFCKSKNIIISELINNAGIGATGDFLNSNIDTQLAMIDLNVRSLTEITHRFIPEIAQSSNGKIMNIASTAAFAPGPGMNVYYATKHYVLAFSEALSEELSSTKTTVTALCPGPTATNFAKSAHAESLSIFKGNLPTAKDVADYGWKSMQSGKRVAVHGKRNKIMVQILRFLPRNFVAKTVIRVQS